MNLGSSLVDAVGRILTPECVRPRTANNAIDPSRWWPATLNANDQVNRDAASVVPTPATENGGSGSTHCSFSAIKDEPRYPMPVLLHVEDCPISCGAMTARDMFEMMSYYYPKELNAVLDKSMEAAFFDEAIMNSEDGYDATFISPQCQAS